MIYFTLLWQEFAAALKEFSPGHDGIKEAEGNAEELSSLKHDLEKKRKEEEAKLKKEQEGKGHYYDLYYFLSSPWSFQLCLHL